MLHAISALYNHGDADVRKQADKWLESWRMTSEAWSAADNILHDPSSPGEAHVFAAQTLRLKVQCSALPALIIRALLLFVALRLQLGVAHAASCGSAQRTACAQRNAGPRLVLAQQCLVLMWPSASGRCSAGCERRQRST